MDTLSSPEHWTVVLASFAIVSLIIDLTFLEMQRDWRVGRD